MSPLGSANASRRSTRARRLRLRAVRIEAIVEVGARARCPPIGIDVSIVAPSSFGRRDAHLSAARSLGSRRGGRVADEPRSTCDSQARSSSPTAAGRFDCVRVESLSGTDTAPGDRPPCCWPACWLPLPGRVSLFADRTHGSHRELVAERTRELHESEQRFRRLSTTPVDTIILHTPTDTKIWTSTSVPAKSGLHAAKNCCR